MSDFLEFTCPSCGRTNLVNPEEIAPNGSYRACQGCGSQVLVPGAGGAEHTSASPDPGGFVHLHVPSGRVERLSREVVEHGIQTKRILPWDMASRDGTNFLPLSELGEFGELFIELDFVVEPQPRCANHAEEMPAGTCRRCGRSFCGACVNPLARRESRICPACAGPIRDPDPRVGSRPLWERPKEAACIPLDGGAWKLTLAVGLLLWIGSFSLTTAFLYLVAGVILIQVVRQSASGATTLSLSLEKDLRTLFDKTGTILLLTIVMVAPVMVLPWILPPVVAVFIQFPISLLILGYYPMALGLLVLGSPKGLEPRSVIGAIARLKEAYLMALFLLVAVGVAVVAFQTVVSFVPFLGSLLKSLALGYGAVLQAYVLGWLLYMNRERILAAA